MFVSLSYSVLAVVFHEVAYSICPLRISIQEKCYVTGAVKNIM